MTDDVSTLYRRVRVNGARLDKLYADWRIEAQTHLSDTISAVTLRGDKSSRSAVWFLNSRYEYCGSHIEFLERLKTSDVLDSVGWAFEALCRTSLSGEPEPVDEAEEFSEMPEFLALHLSLAWSARNMGGIKTLTNGNVASFHAEETGKEADYPSREAIKRLFTTRVTATSLVLLSPFNDAPLKSQLSFTVDNLLAHRFYDSDYKQVFYLIWPRKSLNEAPSLYFPSLETVISDIPLPALLPARILAWMLINPSHVQTIKHAETFDPETFGLGQASSMSGLPPEEKTLPRKATQFSRADLISPSWAFLSTSNDGNKEGEKDVEPPSAEKPRSKIDKLLTRFRQKTRPRNRS